MGKPAHGFEVRHIEVGPGQVEMRLVRFLHDHGHGLQGLLRAGARDGIVLASRRFGDRDRVGQSSYQAMIERAAEHGNRGTLGCFVTSAPLADGGVRVALYERWIDADKLRCEQLAQRVFDAQHPDALVGGAEFAAELRDWARRRNEEREAAALQASWDDMQSAEDAAERRRAANELAAILERAGE